MFEAQLAKASILKKIVDSIKDLVNDAPFDCSENAICLQAMDSSHVALVSLKLGIDLFEAYRCDRTINLGLNLTNVAKALKCANNDDVCVLRFTDQDQDNVTFVFHDANKTKKQDNVTFVFHDANKTKKQELTIKLMDLDNEHLGIPDQKYAATIDMPSAEFSKACRDLSQFSDSISIAATKAGIVFSGKGETGSNVITYSGEKDAENDESGVTFEVNEPVNSTFSIKYMLQFAKASGFSERVRLSLSANVPIAVEYKIEEGGYVRYYLAPKIDDEADMEA
uniref:Proliferating cell nuclear antigen n=1 Tax=Panagrolaimus sp. JU765 TaxID=591449 RepID=A0AC34QUQ7_9BILA